MTELNTLETAVLAKLVDGDNPALGCLRKQLGSVEVVERSLTGVGFFTQLRVSSASPRLELNHPIRFGDVLAEIEGLQHGAGFVLYIDGGVITGLEGYSYDEPWPDKVERFSLRFAKLERDLHDLQN